MGSLENGVPGKRDPLLRSSSTKGLGFQRPILRFSRFLFFGKLDYLQWVCTVAVFCFFVVLFQMFLPGLVMEKSGDSMKRMENGYGDLSLIKNIGGLDFGEGIRFESSKLLQKFQKEDDEINLSSSPGLRHRLGYRKPQLALVSIHTSLLLEFSPISRLHLVWHLMCRIKPTACLLHDYLFVESCTSL